MRTKLGKKKLFLYTCMLFVRVCASTCGFSREIHDRHDIIQSGTYRCKALEPLLLQNQCCEISSFRQINTLHLDKTIIIFVLSIDKLQNLYRKLPCKMYIIIAIQVNGYYSNVFSRNVVFSLLEIRCCVSNNLVNCLLLC